MCFFVGNDFIPHIPTLSIRNGGIDVLLFLYKFILPTLGGYITTRGKINPKQLKKYLTLVGEVEDQLMEEAEKREWFEQNRAKR